VMTRPPWTAAMLGALVAWGRPAAAQPSTAAAAATGDAPRVNPADYDVADAQRPLFIAASSLGTA